MAALNIQRVGALSVEKLSLKVLLLSLSSGFASRGLKAKVWRQDQDSHDQIFSSEL